jgi:hypothetical protein
VTLWDAFTGVKNRSFQVSFDYNIVLYDLCGGERCMSMVIMVKLWYAVRLVYGIGYCGVYGMESDVVYGMIWGMVWWCIMV